jgi:hypothetical protein
MDNYEDEEVVETESPEVELEEVEDTEEVESETEEVEEAVDWEARAKKAEQTIINAKNKKAPREEAPAAKTDSKLSIFDQKAIFNADIETQEDLDEILDYADRKGISVADALKSTVIKATLNENAEIRNSAKAVNTGTGRRASGTVTDAQLMANATNGKMPSSDEDIAKLARMRFNKE